MEIFKFQDRFYYKSQKPTNCYNLPMSEKDFFLDECQNRWIEIHHNGRMYYVDEYNNACWRLFDLRNKFNEGI